MSVELYKRCIDMKKYLGDNESIDRTYHYFRERIVQRYPPASMLNLDVRTLSLFYRSQAINLMYEHLTRRIEKEVIK